MMNEKESSNSVNIDYVKLNRILESGKDFKIPQGDIDNAKTVLILSQHRFYRHLVIELAEAVFTKGGKLKNPLKFIDPLDRVWKTGAEAELKFYTGVSRFKNNYTENRSESDLEALKAIVRNPLCLAVYLHDDKISSSVTASSVLPVK